MIKGNNKISYVLNKNMYLMIGSGNQLCLKSVPDSNSYDNDEIKEKTEKCDITQAIVDIPSTDYLLAKLANIKNGKCGIDQKDENGNTAFFLACYFGDGCLVDKLLGLTPGPDINMQCCWNNTPLMAAIKYGYTDIITKIKQYVSINKIVIDKSLKDSNNLTIDEIEKIYNQNTDIDKKKYQYLLLMKFKKTYEKNKQTFYDELYKKVGDDIYRVITRLTEDNVFARPSGLRYFLAQRDIFLL